MRATALHMAEGTFTLAPSLQLFWPAAPLLLVLDGENSADQSYGDNLAASEWSPLSVRIAYSSLYEGPGDAITGKTRMYFDMLMADQASNAKYVGFLDTDTLFTSWVTDESLFAKENPRIICAMGRPYNPWWERVPLTTSFLLGQPALLWCMTYFPVIVATADLVLLRQHVERVHQKDFVSVWQATLRLGEVSQFDVIGNFLWMYRREHYSWHFQTAPWTLKDYTAAPPGASPASEILRIMEESPALFHPIVRIALHGGWYTPYGKLHQRNATAMHNARKSILLPGVCIALSEEETLQVMQHQSAVFLKAWALCRQQYPLSTSDFQLVPHFFNFESIDDVYRQRDWTWDSTCIFAQSKYINSLQKDPPLLLEKAVVKVLF